MPRIPRPEGYTTYDWMVNLKAEDVDSIEFVDLDRIEAPYRRYEGEEIQEVIDLFQANQCYEYEPAAQWPGFFSSEFHIIMKDGTAHTVCSIYSTLTVIDGAAFRTILNTAWPESGDGPLPENWEEMKASRNYVHPENEASILSTSDYEAGRDALDHEYNTNVEMGCIERGYDIGRNVVRLSATDASSTGLTLNANWWPGSAVGAQLKIKAQYFLERWHEDPYDGSKGYSVMQTDNLILAPEQPLLSGNTVWHINWKDSYGRLEPGYYRIGMTIYEEIGGAVQNETIAYAKFSLTDSGEP